MYGYNVYNIHGRWMLNVPPPRGPLSIPRGVKIFYVIDGVGLGLEVWPNFRPNLHTQH